MDIHDFIAGIKRKANQYNYFLPNTINHSFVISDEKLQKQFEMASFRLGELNS